jgi:hypothetical protein
MDKIDRSDARPLEQSFDEHSWIEQLVDELLIFALLHTLRAKDFKKLDRSNLVTSVGKLASLRDQGNFTDEEFAGLIAYLLSIYVGNEVEERFNKALLNKIPMLLSSLQ